MKYDFYRQNAFSKAENELSSGVDLGVTYLHPS